MRPRCTPGVEEVRGEVYRRAIRVGGAPALLEISFRAGKGTRGVEVDATVRPEPAGGGLDAIERARRMLDLATDPGPIVRALAKDPRLAPLVAATPGLRVPRAWDGFELAVRAILGQQVSVQAATTLAGRLARDFGEPVAFDGAPSNRAALPDAGRARCRRPRAARRAAQPRRGAARAGASRGRGHNRARRQR